LRGLGDGVVGVEGKLNTSTIVIWKLNNKRPTPRSTRLILLYINKRQQNHSELNLNDHWSWETL
jgi:hypothetical protein